MIRKGVYSHQYMDSSDGFDEASLSDKKSFYSELNLEDITDKDYVHAQKVFEEFKFKKPRWLSWLVCSERYIMYLKIWCIWKLYRIKCVEIYELDSAQFLSALGLVWQACLKNEGVKLELIIDIKLLMFEKGIRGGICHAIHRYAKANNKYMKNYDKDIISSYLMYLDANNLYGWAMSQKLPVNGFKWVEKLSRFNEIFIKNYNENSDIGYFLEVDIDYPEKLFNLHKDLPFLPERKKVNKVEKLICSIEDREKYVIHIRVLKQALNHWLVLRKVHRVI